MRNLRRWGLGLVTALGLTALPVAAQAPVAVTIEADKPGPAISRDIFGQFAEMLGEGIYGGVWVGPDSPIPNVRGIRSDVVARTARRSKCLMFAGQAAAMPTAMTGATASARHGRRSRYQHVGQCDRPQHLWHPRIHGFRRADRQRSLHFGQHWRRHPAAGSGLAGIHDRAQPTTLAQERIANGRKEPWRVKFVGLGNENWGCGGGMSAETMPRR